MPAGTEKIGPAEVLRYAELGYGAWIAGPGTDYGSDPNHPQPYDKRMVLAPGRTDVTGAARLLSFFTVSDVHLTGKESPGTLSYAGSSAGYGANIALETYYTPAAPATTQVLDAAIQTVNALHKKTPFDFGIALGDDANDAQYNEPRWFIDVLDGKVITPSSGAHDGADKIDYQKPYKAELVKVLTAKMQAVIANRGTPLSWAFSRSRSRAGSTGLRRIREEHPTVTVAAPAQNPCRSV